MKKNKKKLTIASAANNIRNFDFEGKWKPYKKINGIWYKETHHLKVKLRYNCADLTYHPRPLTYFIYFNDFNIKRIPKGTTSTCTEYKVF